MNFFLLALTLWATPPSWAHPLDIAYLKAQVGREAIQVSLQMNVLAAQRFTRLPDNEGISSKVAARQQAYFAATLGSARWLYDGKPCEWKNSAAALNQGDQGEQLEVTAQAFCPGLENTGAAELEVHLPFLERGGSSYKALGRVERENGAQTTFLADAAKRDVILTLTPSAGFTDFIRMGIEHIGAVPSQWFGPHGFHLPDGIDHILFVLALVMTGGTFTNLAKTISGFTIGHSITLALSALNLAHLPGRLVETIIALSIAYVAIQAFLMKHSNHQWRVAAAFGIFHGFGFASALRDLHLSRHNLLEAIVGFNLGVEAGQLLIIACVLPVLAVLKRRPGRIYEVTLRTCALGIALCGGYWAVQRAFG
jgi:hypothetical protein